MLTLGIAAIVIALSGCSGESGDESSSFEPTTQPPSPTAATISPTATVAQYASAIAEDSRGFVKLARDLVPCAIGGATEFLCIISAETAGLQAQSIDIRLEGSAVDGPGNQLFIGPPPREIESLVHKTRNAAQAVSAASDALSECSKACGSEMVDVSFAAQDLADQLAAWSPYL